MALQIDVQSNSRQARNDLAKLNKSVDNISKTTQDAAKGLQRTVTLITAGVAAFAAGSILTKTTDSYKRLEARIALTNKGLVEQEFAFRKLNDIAIRTRNDQESLADLYSRIGRATKQLGVEQKTVLKVTETISKAITVSGASAESANAAIVQLGQGLAAGALRGQELNSVMEQTPAVANAIAKGMGITIGELRSFAEQGKLTANAIVDALVGQSDFIDEEFSRIAPTFAQSMLVLRTGAGRFLKEMDNVTGGSTRLNKALLNLGKSLNESARPFAEGLTDINTKLEVFSAKIAPITGGLKAIGSSFVNLAGSVVDALSFLPSVALAVYVFDELTASLGAVLPSVAGVTTFLQRLANGVNAVAGQIGKAFQPIKDFLSSVGKGFYDLYIEVVGNSTWPDLIDGVINYAKKIKKALGFVIDFLAEVGKAFAYTLGIVVGLFANFYLSIAVGFSAIATYIAGKLSGAFKDLADYLDSLSDNPVVGILSETFRGLGNVLFKVAIGLGALAAGFQTLQMGGMGVILYMGLEIKEAFHGMQDAVEGFSKSFEKSLLEKTVDGLNKVLNKVSGFAKGVKDAFYDIYDDVVGNSSWPDLVDGVTDYTRKLDEPLRMIKDFAIQVKEYFQDLSDDVKLALKTLLFFFSPLAATVVAFSFLLKELGAPISTLSIAKFGRSIDVAIDSAIQKVSDFTESTKDSVNTFISETGRIVAIGIGGAITALIFGLPGVIAAGSVILLSELDGLFGDVNSLTDQRLKDLGNLAGVFVGTFIAAILASLPDAGAVVAGFVIGIFQGIVNEIPIVGGAISAFVGSVYENFEGLFNAMATLFVGGWLFKLLLPKELFGLLSKGFAKILKSVAAFYTARQATAVAAEGTLLLTHQTGAVAQQGVIATSFVKMKAIVSAGYAAIVLRASAAWTAVIAVTSGAVAAIAARMAVLTAVFVSSGLVAGITAVGNAIVAMAAKAGAALARLLLNPIVALIVGGAFVIGGLAVAIFGEGDSFLDKLANIKDGMDNFFSDLFDWSDKAKIEVDAEIADATQVTSSAQKSAGSDRLNVGQMVDAGLTDAQILQYVSGEAMEGLTVGQLSGMSGSQIFTAVLGENWQRDLQAEIDGKTSTVDPSSLLGGFGSAFTDKLSGLAEKAKTPLSKLRDLFTSIGGKSDNDTLLELDVETSEELVTIYDRVKSLKDRILNATALTLEQERNITKQIEDSYAQAELLQKVSKADLAILKERGFTKEYLRKLSMEELEALVDQRATVDGLLISYKSFAKRLEGLEEIDISLPLKDFSKLGKEAQQNLLDMSARADELKTIMDKIPGTDDDQLRYDAAVLEMEQLTKAAAKFNKEMEKSKAFTSQVRGNFQDTIEGIFKGVNDIGDVFDSVLNDIADRAISNVSESITNVVFGDDEEGLGPLQGLMDGIFGSPEDKLADASDELSTAGESAKLGLASNPMFVNVVNGLDKLTGDATATVEEILPGAGAEGSTEEGALIADKEDPLASGEEGEGLKGVFDKFTTKFSGVLDGFLPGLGGMFDGLLGGLSGAFEGLMGMFGGGGGGGGLGGILGMFGGFFNDGGLVPGGGPTPVIAHGGEMILNKRQQSNLFGQLQSRQSQGGQQTTQNINITGDISRQTKKEIFGMLPTIATGVNQHNREQNR